MTCWLLTRGDLAFCVLYEVELTYPVPVMELAP